MLTMTPAAGGLFDVALDLLVAQLLPNGQVLKDLEKTLNLRLNAEQRDQLLTDGFSMTRTVARTPGASLHIVVRDQPSGVSGSVAIAPRT